MPAFSHFLRYFMAVGRLGSIRKAAEELNVSASAIDRQILRVESELGVPLFERLPTGLRLTAAGEIMMAAGGGWQKSLADVTAQIEDLRGLRRGHVEFAVIDALGKGYAPRLIRNVQLAAPGVTIGLRVLENDLVRLAIAQGDVDFGIFFEPQTFKALTVHAFVDVALGLVVPVDHPLGRRREVRFSACAGMNLVVPAQPLALCEQVAILEAATGVAAHRVVSCDNIQAIVALVQAGVGVGVLTSLDALEEVRQAQLRFVRLTDPVLRPMTLALCTASARIPSHAAALVLGEIENSFHELGFISATEG